MKLGLFFQNSRVRFARPVGFASQKARTRSSRRLWENGFVFSARISVREREAADTSNR
jgi:hypothetical protein